MRSTTPVLVAIGAAIATASVANAGPNDPAYRGLDNSVHAIFDYAGTGAPWTVTAFESFGDEYELDDTAPAGLGANAFVLPNFVDDLPVKYMRLQFYYDTFVQFDGVELTVTAFDSEATTVTEIGRGDADGGTAENIFYIDYRVTPNPDWEEFIYLGNSSDPNTDPGNFYRLEIDTISVPTPATAAPLAAAPLFFRRRRR